MELRVKRASVYLKIIVLHDKIVKWKRNFHVFSDVNWDNLLNKRSGLRWFQTPYHMRHHCNVFSLVCVRQEVMTPRGAEELIRHHTVKKRHYLRQLINNIELPTLSQDNPSVRINRYSNGVRNPSFTSIPLTLWQQNKMAGIFRYIFLNQHDWISIKISIEVFRSVQSKIRQYYFG